MGVAPSQDFWEEADRRNRELNEIFEQVAQDPDAPVKAKAVGESAVGSYWMPAGFHAAAGWNGLPTRIGQQIAVAYAELISATMQFSPEERERIWKEESGGGFWDTVGDVVKAPVRTGLAVANAGYEEVSGQIRNAASVVANAGRQAFSRGGGSPGDRVQAAFADADFSQSQSALGVAVGKVVDRELSLKDFFLGSDKGLGTGWLPDTQSQSALEAAQRARDVLSIDGHAWTPGRFVALSVSEPGTTPYNLLSGLVDAGLNWYADPANAAADVLAAGRQARKNFELFGLVPGHRKTVLPEVVDAWLGSRTGQRVVAGLTGDSDAVSIWRAFDRKIDPDLALRLAGARTTEETLDILRPALGVQIAQRPSLGLRGRLVTPSDARTLGTTGARFRRAVDDLRWAGRVPGRWLRLDDPAESIRTLDDYLLNARVESQARNRILNDAMRAFTADDPTQVAQMLDVVEQATKASLISFGTDADDAARITKIGRQGVDGARIYAHDEIGNNLPVRFLPSLDGQPVELADPHLLVERLNRNIHLPDSREIRRNAAKLRRIKAAGITDTSVTFLDSLNRGWKSLQLLRGAYTVRVIAEEQFRLAANGLPSAFNHPLAWIAYVVGEDSGKLSRLGRKLGVDPKGTMDALGRSFDDVTGDQIEFMQAIGRQLKTLGTEDDAGRRLIYLDDFRLVNRGQNDYLRGWSEELARIAHDPIMVRVANGGVMKGDAGSITEEVVRLVDEEIPTDLPVFNIRRVADEPIEVSVQRPAGAYFSFQSETGDFYRVLRDQQEFLANAAPRKPLEMQLPASWQEGPSSAGEMALVTLLSDAQYQRVKAAVEASDLEAFRRLADELGVEFDAATWRWLAENPDHQYGWFDSLGGAVARREGYDALVAYSPDGPAFSEFVALRPLEEMAPVERTQREVRESVTRPFREGIDGVKDWLMSRSDLRDQLSSMFRQHGADFDDPQVVSAYIDSVLDRWRAISAQDPGLVQALVTRKLPNGKRAINASGLPTSDFRRYLDELREKGVGPERVKAQSRQATNDKARRGYVDLMFRGLMGVPTAKLSRSPAFRATYWDRMADLMKHLDDAGRNALLKQADETIRPASRLGRLRDGTYKKLLENAKAPLLGDTITLEDADDLAKAFALDRVKELLYDVSQRNQLLDTLRFVAPFGEAWKEVITAWAKAFTNDPSNIRRAQQVVQGARGSGFFYQDEQGNEWFNYPGSGALMRWATSLSGGPGIDAPMRGRVESLSLGTSVLPGLGPMVTVPLAKILPNKPQFDFIVRALMPFGEPDTEGGIIETQVVPAWAKKILAVIRDDPESDRVFANTVMETARALVASGEYGTSRDEQLRLWNDATTKARVIMVIRGAMPLFGAPAAPAPNYTIETPDGMDVTAGMLIQEFARMEAEDYDTAVERFLDEFGEDAFLYMTSKSRSLVGGQQASRAYGEWEAENRDLIAKYGEVAGYFGPQQEGFDFTVYNRQLAAGTRERRTPRELIEEGHARIAQWKYNRKRDMLPSNPTPEQRKWLRDWKAKLAEQYPGWNPEGFSNNQPEAVRQLYDAVDDPKVMDTAIGGALATYLSKRDLALEQLEQRGLAANRFQFSQAKSAEDLRAWLYDWGNKLAAETPEFARLWDEVLSREVEDLEAA